MNTSNSNISGSSKELSKAEKESQRSDEGEERRRQDEIQMQRIWLFLVFVFGIGILVILYVAIQARKEVDLERAKTVLRQSDATERGETKSQSTSVGLSGLLLLRELTKPQSISAESPGIQQNKTYPVSFLVSLVDSMAAIGSIPLNVAKNIKDDLLKESFKAGMDVSTHTIKAIVDRYIALPKAKELQSSSGNTRGDTLINLACNGVPQSPLSKPPIKLPDKSKTTCECPARS